MIEPDPTQESEPDPAAGQDETVDASHGHPSDDQLCLFVGGRLAESEVAEIESHLESCNACPANIDALRVGINSFFEGLDQKPLTSDPDQTVETIDEITVDPGHQTTVGFDYEAGKSTKKFGDYALIDEIARGGMGVVYRARHISLNRIVALKMIKSGELANQEQVDRFHKEAEAAAKLDYPGIVPVHDVGVVDGQHFFTMAYVDGESLSVRLREGPCPPSEAARYAKEIAEAVAYAHSKGVIHRDLKPGNVLITKEATLRITDFGLAKRIEDDSELTSTGQVLGTPSYMPPEQAEGKLKEIGPGADIYAIGATLYCMLVGRPPFQAANVVETLQQVLERAPVSLSSQNPSVPPDLETLCFKCLEKKPSNRYPTAQELVNELTRFLNGEPIQARPIGKVDRAFRWCKRKPLAASLLLAVFILAIGGPWAAIAQSRANTRTAMAKVDALLDASPAAIPIILQDLDGQASVVRSRLDELDADDSLEAKKRLRVSLALLPYDSTQLNKLRQRLNDFTYEELAVVLDRIEQNGGSVLLPDLWTTFRNQSSLANNKFRAGIALAALDPDSENWEDRDYDFLVNSMLAVNTVYQSAVRRSLAPIATKLVGAVKAAYELAEPGTLADESSANAIVDFAADDTNLLAELSSSASTKQHSIVFPVIEAKSETDDSIVDDFIEITKLQPMADDDEPTRIKLGKERAGAAINLVRLEKYDEALEALRVRDDLESLTQFVHGCKARGIRVEQLLDLLNRATTVSERYGIILALGEFALSDIPEDIRPMWVEHVKALYANDPSSGIHGSSGWLLRQWGLSEEAKAIEEREVPYSTDREWFTLKINLSGPLELELYSYFTFVVFPAGEYEIGSPDYERDRDPSDERRRLVKISRSFAMLDREVTRGEVVAVTEFRGFRDDMPWGKDPFGASSGMNWYLAVTFCRGLTNRRGFGERDQVYADPSQLDRDKYPIDPSPQFPWDREGAFNWPFDFRNSGFRLPSGAEWETACRSGSVTAFGFGSDRGMLDLYAWYQGRSGKQGHRPRKLRPNLRGLFDVHGNMYEWCQEWSGGNTVDVLTDPMGPREGSLRVLRGGAWDNNETRCRSAYRLFSQPSNTGNILGFRVVLSIDGSSSHPQ